MNRQREKLVNATLFFASNTINYGLTKMMKLINFFEFEHFNQTGKPPIGLTYHADKNGPIPYKLWREVNDGAMTKDFNNVFELKTVFYPEYNGYCFVPREGKKPNLDIFTPRELRIMRSLAEEYYATSAVDMSDISHKDKMPWSKTIAKKGPKGEIDYLDALTEDSVLSLDDAQLALEDFNEANLFFDLDATISE